MKLLLPVDGSDLSLNGVRFAIRMAQSGLQTEMVLANVQQSANLYELIVAHDPAVIESICAKAAAHVLAPARQLLDDAELNYECEVGIGEPANTIADIAERFGCDLIVLGTHGKTALGSAVTGSAAADLLHVSAVPVLMVKPDQPAMAVEEEADA